MRCAGARAIVTRSGLRRQNNVRESDGRLSETWTSINLCCSQCAHLSGWCVCRAHLSICVDSRAPQAARPGCGSGRITGITRSSAEAIISSCPPSPSSFRAKRIILSFLLPHRTLVLITSYVSPLGEILKRFPKMKIPACFIFLTPQSTAFS